MAKLPDLTPLAERTVHTAFRNLGPKKSTAAVTGYLLATRVDDLSDSDVALLADMYKMVCERVEAREANSTGKLSSQREHVGTGTG